MIPHFTNGSIWRHDRFMDVDMKIISGEFKGYFIKLRVVWIHRRHGEMDTDEQDVIVTPDQYKFWRRIE